MSAEAIAYTIFGGICVNLFVLLVKSFREAAKRVDDHRTAMAVMETSVGYLGRRMDKIETTVESIHDTVRSLHLAHSASGRLRAVGDDHV